VVNLPNVRKHVSASLNRYTPNIAYLEFDRGPRIAGNSKMNLQSLALHGWKSLAVYSDIALGRLLIGMVLFVTFLGAGSLIAIMLKIFGLYQTIPGWLSIMVYQSLLSAISLIFIVLVVLISTLNRNQNSIRKVL
jgi:hypothetical protein